jgi:hypothetical protein
MPAHNPELIAVHLLPEDIHPAQTAVDAVDGVLQVHLPKQRNKKKKEVLITFPKIARPPSIN